MLEGVLSEAVLSPWKCRGHRCSGLANTQGVGRDQWHASPQPETWGEWKTRGRKERQALKDPAGRRDRGGPSGGRERFPPAGGGGRAAPHLALGRLVSRHRQSSPLFLQPLSLFPQASPTTEAQDLKEARGIVTNHRCARTCREPPAEPGRPPAMSRAACAGHSGSQRCKDIIPELQELAGRSGTNRHAVWARPAM